MRPLLAALLLGALSSAPTTAQAPNLQDVGLLPGTPVVGPGAGTQRTPFTCRGASSSLLVFEDNRAGDRDLFGVRLDAGGAAIDALPFPIAKDPGDQSAPVVAWNGQSWLVVYSNQVDPGSGYFAYEFAARRVSPSGQVLDAAPIQLATDSTGGNFGVGSVGGGWVVAYTGYSAGNNGITAKRVAADGSVLDPAGVVVSPPTYYILGDVRVSDVGGSYAITWADGGTRVRRFDASLTPLDAGPALLSPMTGKLSSSGASLLLVALRQTPQFLVEVVGARFGADLSPLDAAPFTISGAVQGVSPSTPAATWDGTQWIASWLTAGTQTALAARVTASGQVLDPGGVQLPDGAPYALYEPNLGALPSGGALFAWVDARYATNHVFASTLGANGVPGAERSFGDGTESQRSPRITQGASQYLVTYKAELGTGSRILAQRVDPLGGPIDAEPIEAAAATHRSLFAGGAAWNGSVYLVTWTDGTQGQVLARRLAPDGTWVDPAPIPVLLGSGADAAALGSDFLVTALRAPSYPQYVFSFGARVRGSDGAVLDSPPLFIGQSYATRARVTTLGGRWLVLTESHWTHDENQAGLLINFVDAAGGVSSTVNAGTLNIQNWGSVDVASSGTSALVIGQSGSNWTNTDVFARRVLADGTLSGAMLNVTSFDPRGQSRASVSWSGSEYVVLYESYQNNAWYYDYEPDVYAVRVSETGTLLDTNGFALWDGEDWESQVDAGSVGEGKALFAASTYVDAPFAAPRVALRSLRPKGLSNFGTGTAGCNGPHRMDAAAEPWIGNPWFELSATCAPQGGAGLLVISTGADLAGADPLGLGMVAHVDLTPPNTFFVFVMPVAGDGVGRRGIVIPDDPSFEGLPVYAQTIFAWSGPCHPSPSDFSSTDGLRIELHAQ